MSLACLALTTNAQSTTPWNFESPKADEKVHMNEVYIVLKVTDANVRRSSIKLKLGRKNITEFIKWRGNTMTVLLLDQYLKEGNTKITCSGKLKSGKSIEKLSLPITIVDPEHKITHDDRVPTYMLTTDKKLLRKTNLSYQGSAVQLSGPASELRQEPTQVHRLRGSGKYKYQKWSFPYRFTLTSNETNSSQSRNRFLVGAVHPGLEVYYGDIFPKAAPMMVYGMRVRGLKVNLKVSRETSSPMERIEYIVGDINRPVEGAVVTYDPITGAPPTTLANDSTYIRPGVFRREMHNLRFLFRNVRRNFKFDINYLKITDDESSITYGATPNQNLVFGLNQAYNSKRKIFQFNSGLLGSLFTNDISLGVAHPDDIKKHFGISIPDPIRIRRFIILNTSSLPVNPLSGSSLAGFVEAGIRIKTNHIKVKLKQVGASYITLADPFLRTDRRGITIEDRLRLFKNKVSLSAMYNLFQNNLSEDQFARKKNENIRLRSRLKPFAKGPSITLRYDTYNRKSGGTFFSSSAANDNIQTVMAGVTHAFKTRSFTHSFNLMISQIKRTDLIRERNNMETVMLSGYFREQFPKGISASIQIGQYEVATDVSGDLLLQQNMSGNLSYKMSKKTSFALIYTSSNTSATTYLPATQRVFYKLSYTQKLFKKLDLNLLFSYSEYDEGATLSYYHEPMISARLRYSFDSITPFYNRKRIEAEAASIKKMKK